MKVRRIIYGESFYRTYCSAQGCYYRPSPKSCGDEMEDYNISDSQTDSREGSYYIGTRVLPREFELDCYFEEMICRFFILCIFESTQHGK